MKTFYFEMTDTFGSDLNYCWLRMFEVKAKNLHGALCKLSKEIGLNFRSNGLYYKAKSACVGLYELEYDPSDDWIEKAIKL